MSDADPREVAALRRTADEHGFDLTDEEIRAAADAGARYEQALAIVSRVEPWATQYWPCGCLRNAAGAHRGDCPEVDPYAGMSPTTAARLYHQDG